MPSKIKY